MAPCLREDSHIHSPDQVDTHRHAALPVPLPRDRGNVRLRYLDLEPEEGRVTLR